MTGVQSHLAGLVLAAGGAARFAAPKQLARFGAETLVARAVRLAQGCCGAGVVVVTGAWAEAVGAGLAGHQVQLAFNPAWRSGMASSLVCGLAALPVPARACMILLCDQPLVDAPDLDALLSAWQAAPAQAAAAAYAGTLGVPAIFPAALWPLLAGLVGDRGARAVLAALPQVSAVPMPHAAADVDTAADLQRLLRS